MLLSTRISERSQMNETQIIDYQQLSPLTHKLKFFFLMMLNTPSAAYLCTRVFQAST
jgi:hypothetical protein